MEPAEYRARILTGAIIFGGKHGNKRLGRVKALVFDSKGKRCVGLVVKRPDALLMMRRSDGFVPFDAFAVSKEEDLFALQEMVPFDEKARKSLGLSVKECVSWLGLPVMTVEGEDCGRVKDVVIDAESGEVRFIDLEEGIIADALLGRRSIEVSLIRGFRPVENEVTDGTFDEDEETLRRGAIVVDQAVDSVELEGGLAEAAGQMTARIAGKARRITADVSKKGESVSAQVVKKARQTAEDAKPKMKQVAKDAGDLVEEGAFKLGRQIGRSIGSFASFREEYRKAVEGDDSKQDSSS